MNSRNKVDIHKRYWAAKDKIYHIRGNDYRFCNHWGGNQKTNGKTKSQDQGEKLIKFLNDNDLLVNKYKNQEIQFIVGDEPINHANLTQEEILWRKKKMNQNEALNTILFGPPGTGKTYNTIGHALSIIMEKESDEERKERYESVKDKQDSVSRKALKTIFDQYVDNGQIVFTTFHQSYGYEEFIEGIKPELDEKELNPELDDEKNSINEVNYKIADGIFKNICLEASNYSEINNEYVIKNDTKIWKFSLGKKNYTDKMYMDEALRTNSISLGWGGDINFSNCKNINDIKAIYPDHNNKKTGISQVDMFKHVMKDGDLVIISDGISKYKALAEVIGDYFYDDESSLPQKRKIKWIKYFDKSRLVSEISDKDFHKLTINQPRRLKLDAIQHLINADISSNEDKNYILIIDEINRGNISKIFGELITLIEPSKRIGSEEAIEVNLPYSGKPFGVPKNVYIIGTMNTADRSIALMDTALRRRFEFIEMMPDYKVIRDEVGNIDLGNQTLNVAEMLETINQRITYLYDRDHQIGHAYLLSLKGKEDKLAELDSIFRNKIIPLLQEYFYDDWEKIQMVLGDHDKQQAQDDDKFIVSNLTKEKALFGFNHEDIEDEKVSYRINANFTAQAYLKLTKSS